LVSILLSQLCVQQLLMHPLSMVSLFILNASVGRGCLVCSYLNPADHIRMCLWNWITSSQETRHPSTAMAGLLCWQGINLCSCLVVYKGVSVHLKQAFRFQYFRVQGARIISFPWGLSVDIEYNHISIAAKLLLSPLYLRKVLWHSVFSFCVFLGRSQISTWNW
jgi:hypothetical protein